MKIKYYIENNKKVYTLKQEHNGKPTQDAHYKFIKIKTAEKEEFKSK